MLVLSWTNPASVYHLGSSEKEKGEATVGLPSTAFILPTVVFRAGPVDKAGLGSPYQHGTSDTDKHLEAVDCKLDGLKNRGLY